MAQTQVTADVIRHMCGEIADWKVTAILDVDGDLEDLEEAVAWSTGDDENPPKRHLNPQGAASRIYDILIAGEEEDDRR